MTLVELASYTVNTDAIAYISTKTSIITAPGTGGRKQLAILHWIGGGELELEISQYEAVTKIKAAVIGN